MSDTELFEDVIAWNDTIFHAAILVSGTVWAGEFDEISSDLWERIPNVDMGIRKIVLTQLENPS